jgi:hypothetical protein
MSEANASGFFVVLLNIESSFVVVRRCSRTSRERPAADA